MAEVIRSGTPKMDLTECDREPIHIPGAIQGHGVLIIVVEPELTIANVSVNVRDFFGVEPLATIGRPLARLIGPGAESTVAAGLRRGTLSAFNPIRVVVGERAFDAILHRNGPTTIVELEPNEAPAAKNDELLRPVLTRLQAATRLSELLAIAVEEIRTLTGFDRVMAYRFLEDGHGEVVQEARAQDLDPYLGQHYPATDIPIQARRLYVLNWLRIIPDVAYEPVPLVSSVSPSTGEPPDLSGASLRSVSPVHVEYLRNMGVRASMSISVVRGQALLGLFACHHREPRRVPFVLRATCELIGRFVSMQAAALLELAATAQRSAIQDAEVELVEAVRGHPEGWAAGLLGRTSSLLRIVTATGVAICDDDRVHRVGATPTEGEIRGLVAWLDQRRSGSFQTHALSQAYAPAREYSGVAGGLLAITIPKPTPSHVLWFRYETPRTVTWSGDPSKPAESAGESERIHPRRSFAAWLENVRGISSPWTRAEIDVAEDLRRHAVEIDLARHVVRAEQAIRARDEILAIVSHDLRSPLSLIRVATTFISRDSERLRTGVMVGRIQQAVSQMNTLISDLLDLARIEAGKLPIHPARCDATELVSNAVAMHAPLAEERGIFLVCSEMSEVRVMGDRERLYQVLSNLLSNAIKFTPAAGSIHVDVHSDDDNARFSVRDTGPGISPSEQARIFDRYAQGDKAGLRPGAGLGLYIAKGIVDAHGGRIWVESVPGRGSTFAFTIPRT